MVRFVVVLVLLTSLVATPVEAQAGCAFQNAFKDLHDALPGVVGDCITNEYDATDGTWRQQTAMGSLTWRASDGVTWFTAGGRTWVLTPNGPQEAPPTPALAAPPPQAPAARGPLGTASNPMPCAMVPGLASAAYARNMNRLHASIADPDAWRHRERYALEPDPGVPAEVMAEAWRTCTGPMPGSSGYYSAPPPVYQPAPYVPTSCWRMGNYVTCS